jgi:hypothetical protein
MQFGNLEQILQEYTHAASEMLIFSGDPKLDPSFNQSLTAITTGNRDTKVHGENFPPDTLTQPRRFHTQQ